MRIDIVTIFPDYFGPIDADGQVGASGPLGVSLIGKAGARGDIERITTIWRECIGQYGGPYLFGTKPCAADAMYAPVCSRFATYDVALEGPAKSFCRTIMAMPLMQDWIAGAKTEPDELEELDVEF